MKITAMQEYGLRCMLQLASHKSEDPMTVKDIASREHLTPVYVEKILVNLRRAGLVKSIRGVNGGYMLNQPPKRISVAMVLGALGQVGLGKSLCNRFTGSSDNCTHLDNCGIRQVWGVLTRHIFGFLNQLDLEQLSRNEAEVNQKIEQLENQGAFVILDSSSKTVQ